MAAKSSSTPVAALLLVAAVLVAMSAPGAHALVPGNVDFVNTCEYDAFVIFTNGVVVDTLVKAGKTVGVDLTPLQGVIGPLNFTIQGVVYLFPGISNLTGVLVRLDIICNSPECGSNRIAIRPYVQILEGGPSVPLPVVCLDVVVT